MQLSIGQQRALFVVLVILLAGVGIYLVGPGRSHGGGAAPTASVSAAASLASPAPAPLVVPSAEVAPTPITVPTAIKSANIYDWLPFTQQDLNDAANVTLAFAAADQTFNNTDTATTYGQRLKNLVTPTFLGTLEQRFRPPGATGMTSKSSGTISQIASFGARPASITFVITFTEQTTTGGKTTSTTTQNDVTTIAVAGGWQVNDIELAGVGN
jgi:hypothetical protein